MASIFDNLGQGLQDAGSILSPDVAQRQAQQRQLILRSQLATAMQNRQLAARAIIAGVQSGSIDPKVGQEKLAQLGLGNVPVGPSLEAQGNAALIKALGGGGMNPSTGLGAPTPSPGQSNPNAGSAAPTVPQIPVLPPAAMLSPAAGRYIQYAEAQRNLNKPQVSYDSQRDRVVQTYPDGHVTTVDLGGGDFVRSGFGKELIDSGVKPNSPEWNAAWKKRISRETAPTQTQINLTSGSSPLGQDKDFWFKYYHDTKQLPPMAWGAAGNPTRQQFLAEYPKWAKAHGEDAADTAAAQASYKANAAALSRVTVDLNSFEPYKKMLDTNADIAIQLGKKISQTNSALINKPLNWLRQNATSNPDVAEYLAQIRFVQTEAARVINNPRIVGQLTDESRKEIEQVINGNAPIAVVDRVLNRLKIDGGNRFSKMREQQADIVNQMKGSTTAPQSPAQQAPSQQPTSKTVDWSTLK